MDLGTQRVKAVVLKDDAVAARAQAFSGFNPTEAAEQAVTEALKVANLQIKDVANFVATGAAMESAPYTKSTVSMMGADAKATSYLFPKARTIIDVGAEEARAIKCDEKGVMVDFVVNERCAAGAGAFIEAMARALEVKLEDIQHIKRVCKSLNKLKQIHADKDFEAPKSFHNYPSGGRYGYSMESICKCGAKDNLIEGGLKNEESFIIFDKYVGRKTFHTIHQIDINDNNLFISDHWSSWDF